MDRYGGGEEHNQDGLRLHVCRRIFLRDRLLEVGFCLSLRCGDIGMSWLFRTDWKWCVFDDDRVYL